MKVLPQFLVTRYAKYAALKNALDKWLAEKRLEIIDAFRAGARCPDRGPFLLELGDAADKPSWKDEFHRHLVMEDGCTDEQAAAALEAIAERARLTKVPRLYSKRNPNYRREYPIRLPA